MERWLDFPDDVILKLKTKYGMEVEYPIEWFGVNSPAKKRQKSDLKSQKIKSMSISTNFLKIAFHFQK